MAMPDTGPQSEPAGVLGGLISLTVEATVTPAGTADDTEDGGQ